jgi:N-acetylglucosaminyldiphosphoundecaprenol N-acetyl-beta-D-mannosaminyltransferase
MNNKGRLTAEILDIPVFGSTKDRLLSLLLEDFRLDPTSRLNKAKPAPILIFTPNPEMLLASVKDKAFRQVLLEADYNIPDGVGVIWASKLLASKKNQITISEQITGTDLMLELSSIASQRGWRIFLLGAAPGVARKAAANLKQLYPKLQIQAEAGPDDVSRASEEETRKLVKQINDFSPQLLFVAFGHGKQESWLVAQRPYLRVGLAMGVGGALDFVAGQVKRAPESWRRLGFEWLYRWLQQPRRSKRIADAIVKFPLLVVREYFS